MISVRHLTKRYGEVTAVRDLSFEIGQGQVYGFLGPNGAGKSTTLNMITGVLSATAGEIRVGGYDIFQQPGRAKSLIGYLPEQPPLYLSESPREYLRFVGQAKGLRGRQLAAQIDAVLEQTGLTGWQNRRIAALSKGYRQRVGIAQALLGSPQVIVLDEPTVGLDPIQIVEIRSLIRQLGQAHTVIFSSHILSEVQMICDQVLIIAHGELVACDQPANLERRLCAPGGIHILTNATQKQLRALVQGLPGVAAVQARPAEDGLVEADIQLQEGLRGQELYRLSRAVFEAFARSQPPAALLEMSVRKPTLEQVFLELTEASAPPPGEGTAEEAPGTPGAQQNGKEG